MAATEYNLSALYASMFGYRAISNVNLRYAKQDVRREVDKPGGYNSLNTAFNNDAPEIERSSWMGVPIIMPVDLSYFKDGIEIKIPLQLEPIIQIKGSKTIVETKIDGQEGSFKEMFNLNDYEITIQGVIVTEDNLSEQYPQEAVRLLREACEARVPLKISNMLLSIFNIDQVVVYEWDFPTVPGENTLQGYELICKSDRQFELELQ